MKRLKNECKNQMRRHRKGTSRFLALFLALAMIVSLGVDLSTTSLVHATERQGEPAYTCGKTEHVHSIENGCYALTCGLDETDGKDGHEHTLSCYDGVEPTCGNEDEDHEHTLDCYDGVDPICGLETGEGAVEEHHHTDECYDTSEYICGKDYHEHDESCVESSGNSNKEETGGEDDKDNDSRTSNADYDKQWTKAAEETLDQDKNNEETKAATLADVASSQAGYTAQIADADADDEDAEALYSLYSNWYTNGDNSTKDWNTTFVFWALDQAGFDTERELDASTTDLPIRSDIQAWVRALKAKEEATADADNALSLYMNTAEDGLSVTAGDILFLDLNQDGSVDHVGIAASADTDEDTGVTSEVAIVIADLDQKTLADLDETNDALDSDNSDANVAAAIALPADDYDWDDDSDDALQEYLESYIMGVVPTSLYEQQVEAIEDGDPEDETDDEPDLAPGTIYGKTYTTKRNTANAIMMASSNDADAGVSPTDGDTLTGIDLNSKLGSVKFEKQVGSVWQESSEFTTDDRIRATITFDNIQTSQIKANGNTLYVQLPSIIDCSGFTGTYETYDGSTKSGTYQYQKVGDNWYVVLTLDTDYVNDAGDYIGGELDFEFSWDKEQIPDEGKTTEVIIGDQGATVKIEKGKDDGESKGHKYNLYKQAGSLEWSEDGKTAYITYTVNLTVNNAAKAPITLSDVLSGTGFVYDDAAPTITGGSNVKVNYSNKNAAGTGTDIQVWPMTGNDVPAGNYTITYKVKTTAADARDWNIGDQTLENEISVPDDDGTKIPSKTWTTVTTGTIDKKGNLVTGSDGIYIDYTVYLNSGTIVKNIKTPAEFKDTLPDNVQLQGNVTVKQFKPDGTLVNTTNATVSGQNISYTTPTGQYYYIITYRTKLKDSVTIPAEGLVVKNTGTSTGGIDGSSESEVVIPNQSLKKNYVSQNLAQINDKWTDTIKWSSTIDVDKFNGYEYEDWGGLMQKADQYWFSPLTMSDSQRVTIKVTDKNGNTVDSSKYTITTSDHTGLSTQPADANGTLVTNGLFKIKFTSDNIEGPVRLEYETSVDMSNFTIGAYLVFINHASLTKDGKSVYAQAQTTTLEYAIDLKKVIHKYGAGWSTGSSENVTLDPGQDYISWTIGVNEGMAMYDDLVVTDTLQDGLTLDESSLKVWLSQVDLLHLQPDQQDMAGLVSYTYDKVTNKLVINIDKKAYSGTKGGQKYSQALKITFNTKLPEDFISGGDAEKTFKNTATVSRDGGEETPSTYEETVKRQVVGKSGSYDPETRTLNYQIVLNPDAATLINGKTTLKVTDTLDAGDLKEYIQLESIELFTAVKTTNSKGDVEVKPGKYVRTLSDIKTTGATALTEGDLNHYLWVPSADATGATAANTFVTYIEDSTAYVAVVKYSITTDIAADTQMNNHVEIEGDNKWSKTDSTVKATQKTSGETYTGHRLKIIKHDTASYDTLLGGAIFRVDKYVDGTWTEGVTTLTTADGTGAASSPSNTIEAGVLYRVIETQAPDGYLKDDTPSYFVILVGSATMPTLPDGITSDKVLTVHVDDGKSANVIIDRYDRQDETKVTKGQLAVTKEWLAKDGTTLSNTDGLTATVTLTKTVPAQSPQITFKHSTNSPVVISYDPGDYLYVKINGYRITHATNDLTEAERQAFYNNVTIVDANGNALSSADLIKEITWDTAINGWDLKIGPFSGDVTITSEAIYWDGQNQGWRWTDGGTPVTDATTTTIGSVVLSKDNEWRYRWTDLDTTNGITYTLTETAMDGYTTTYKLNNKDLEAGTAITPSESGDRVTVTNTKQTTELIVHKVWNDGGADHTTTDPKSVTVRLYRNGTATDKTLTLDATKDWTGKFENLEIDDGNGNTYDYTVVEDAIADYTVEYSYTTVKPDWYTADTTAGSSVKYATVTNTKQYKMPSTGGAGTLPYTLGGSAALISSMFAGCSMWRRRRDERRCD